MPMMTRRFIVVGSGIEMGGAEGERPSRSPHSVGDLDDLCRFCPQTEGLQKMRQLQSK